MNPTERAVIAVFGSSGAAPGDALYESGVECGAKLAAAGFAVATGGYGGIMEAVCKGAAEGGGPTIGVTAPTVFPGRSGANPWVEHEIPAADLIERIGILTSIAAGCIAMPGSLGTLAELVMAWNLAFVAPFTAKSYGPIIAVGDTWAELVPDLTVRLATDGDHVITVATVDEAIARLTQALG